MVIGNCIGYALSICTDQRSWMTLHGSSFKAHSSLLSHNKTFIFLSSPEKFHWGEDRTASVKNTADGRFSAFPGCFYRIITIVPKLTANSAIRSRNFKTKKTVIADHYWRHRKRWNWYAVGRGTFRCGSVTKARQRRHIGDCAADSGGTECTRPTVPGRWCGSADGVCRCGTASCVVACSVCVQADDFDQLWLLVPRRTDYVDVPGHCSVTYRAR